MIAGLLVLLAFASYGTVLTKGGWIWDDGDYVINNATVRQPDQFKRIWTDPQANPQYYPLVYSTFRMEYHLNPPPQPTPLAPGEQATNLAQLKPVPPDPTLFHFNNVLIFALTVLLFWRVLQKLRIPGALIATLLFAAHPVNVESVAWVTERKNMLSGLFGLATILMYLRYCRIGNADDDGTPRLANTDQPGGSQNGSGDDKGNLSGGYFGYLGWGSFATALIFWFAGLFSKTVIAFIPPALFLIIWWKRPRELWRLTPGLIPFFAGGLFFGLRTAELERTQVGAEGFFDLAFAEKLVLAGSVVWKYFQHVVAPVKQMFFYPKWDLDTGSIVMWGMFVAAVALPLILLWKSKKLGRGPLVAVLIFGGALFPVMGFVPVYPMRFSHVADHFQYHANWAMFALIGAVLVNLPIPRNIGRGALGVVLAWFVYSSNVHGLMYQNVETLWRTTLKDNPSAWMAYENLGVELKNQGKIEEALDIMNQGLQVERDPHLLMNLAGLHLNQYAATRDLTHLDVAESYMDEALETWPNRIDFNMVYGNIMVARGPQMAGRAVEYYEHAVNSILNDEYQKVYLEKKLTNSPMVTKMIENWFATSITEGNKYTYLDDYAKAAEFYSKSYQRYGGPGTKRWRELYRWSIGTPFLAMELRRIWTLAACPDPKVRKPEQALEQVKELWNIAGQHLGAGGVPQSEMAKFQVAIQDAMAVCFANAGQYMEAVKISGQAIQQAIAQQAPPAYVEQLRLRSRTFRQKQPFYYQKMVPVPPGL
jgi:protein O-mannosyl-transferase